jgi:uncharacterized protein (DUF1501 family)
MTISRRTFLKTATASVGALIAPSVLLRARPARAVGSDPVLIALFLRGGADALSLVVPHGDPTYYSVRPTIQVPAGQELDLDGFFGFHPALAPLLPLYQSGRLAVLHACGSPSDSRSHFDSQDFMEFAAPDDKTVQVGWLNRFLTSAGLGGAVTAVTIENAAAKSLSGPVDTIAIPALSRFSIYGTYPTERRDAIRAICAASPNTLLRATGTNAIDIVTTVSAINTTTSTVYPTTKLGSAMKDLAALIKADIGLRVAAVNHSSWDHHAMQNINLPIMAGDLSSSLAAFANDLGSDLDRTVVLVMSEFGRRVGENGATGSDHGHGAIMMALGGSVAGGNGVIMKNGQWPGLAQANLFDGIDLKATTDFRDVFGELLDRHMGLSNLAGVFPNFTSSSSNYPGIFA